MTLVATVTLQAFRLQRDTLRREQDTTAASLAMETITRDVRQALSTQPNNTTVNAFATSLPSSLTVITWVSSDPVKVTYTLDNGNLTRSVKVADMVGQGVASTFTNASPVATTTTLVGNVTGSALFKYTLKDGTSAASYTAANDQASISGVQVTLRVNSDVTGKLPGTMLVNSVVCQNL
ncbi:type II secretion system protein J [Kineococcus sp. GCM10028916]|uniref:PulJ/GspJ family protein n=1 Tax=Kineococcus sp. GCM10028916 TaxID=3273394 RepID=UPI0036D33E38